MSDPLKDWNLGVRIAGHFSVDASSAHLRDVCCRALPGAPAIYEEGAESG